jgi:hypothetical protein
MVADFEAHVSPSNYCSFFFVFFFRNKRSKAITVVFRNSPVLTYKVKLVNGVVNYVSYLLPSNCNGRLLPQLCSKLHRY